MTDHQTQWERAKAVLERGLVPADVGPTPCRLILHVPLPAEPGRGRNGKKKKD